MNDIKTPEFKLRLNDENIEPSVSEEVVALRIEKVSRRITLFSILILCLVGAVLLFAYLDIKDRLGKLHVTGASDTQKLTQALESKFSSLSVQQAKTESALVNKISDLEKTTASLIADMDKTEKTLEKINLTKADKKELVGATAEIDKTLAAQAKDLKNVSSEIKASADKLAKDLAETSAQVAAVKQERAKFFGIVERETNELKKMQTDITTLSSAKADKTALDLALQNQQKAYQQKLGQLADALERKIESIRKKIKELEEHPDKQKGTEPPPESVPAGKPMEKPLAPMPGTIIEQNIQ